MKTHAYAILRNLAGLALILSHLAGCSWARPYTNTPEKNLTIRTAADSNLFSSVRSSVDVYGVDENCQAVYLGTVKLDETRVEVGVPAGKPSYLVFVFASSSFLANNSGTISYDTLLRPRVAYHYDIEVSYQNKIYNVEIRETALDKTESREVEPIELNACGDYLIQVNSGVEPS